MSIKPRTEDPADVEEALQKAVEVQDMDVEDARNAVSEYHASFAPSDVVEIAA